MATTAKIGRDERPVNGKAVSEEKFACRHRNRCFRCGRPRGFLRKFKLCRICFRKLALAGEAPGGSKGRWERAGWDGDFNGMMTNDPIPHMLTRTGDAISGAPAPVR